MVTLSQLPINIVLLNILKSMKTPTYLVLLLIIFSSYSARAADKYTAGYYIDSTQHKVEGLIAFDGTDCENFLFKKQLGDKTLRINVAKCPQFHMGDHEYVAIGQVDFVTIIRKRHINKAFAELLESGNVKLYMIGLALSRMDAVHKAAAVATELSDNAAGGNMSGYFTKKRIYYYVKRDIETQYTLVEHRKSKFKRQMGAYLKDKPEVVAQLNKNKDYDFNNIELIVHAYNGNLPLTTK